MFNYALIAVVITAALILAPATGAHAAGSPRAAAPGLSVSDGGRHAGKAPSAGRNEYLIESGGIERRYLMYLPDGHDDSSPLPVVFDFHGSGSDPDEEMQVSGLANAAERDGFLLLMPAAVVEFPAGGHTWNVPPDRQLPDDVQFALDVLDHAAERVRINEQRVYVTGFSGGARPESRWPEIAPRRRGFARHASSEGRASARRLRRQAADVDVIERRDGASRVLRRCRDALELIEAAQLIRAGVRQELQ